MSIGETLLGQLLRPMVDSSHALRKVDTHGRSFRDLFALQRLSETYSGVFCKADVDECGELAAEVTSLPTFVVYKKANGGWYIADRVGINTQCVVQNKQLFI